MIAEPWMETLRAGVEAGYWKIENAGDGLTPLPAEPAPVRFLFDAVRGDGYLCGPRGGTPRRVSGLAPMLADLARFDIGLWWDDTEGRYATATHRRTRGHQIISIDSDVWGLGDARTCDILGVMIGACVLHTDDFAVVRDWARGRYGSVIGPNQECS